MNNCLHKRSVGMSTSWIQRWYHLQFVYSSCTDNPVRCVWHVYRIMKRLCIWIDIYLNPPCEPCLQEICNSSIVVFKSFSYIVKCLTICIRWIEIEVLTPFLEIQGNITILWIIVQCFGLGCIHHAFELHGESGSVLFPNSLYCRLFVWEFSFITCKCRRDRNYKRITIRVYSA